MNSFDSIILQSDIDTLRLLGSYESGDEKYIDVNEVGNITSMYEAGAQASIWRSFSYYSGNSKNSDDIANIEKLFDRVLVASIHDRTDYSELVKSSVSGLKNLKIFYSDRNEKACEIVKGVILRAEKAMEKMANDNQQEREQFPARGFTPLNVALLADSMIADIPEEKTKEVIQAGFKIEDSCTGIAYWSDKIEAFLVMEKENLSPQALSLFKKLQSLLKESGRLYQMRDVCWWVENIRDDLEEKLGVRLRGDDCSNAIDQSVANLAFEQLEALSVEDQEKIGILIPCGWKPLDASGHFCPIALRKKRDNTYTLHPVNAGGGFLGEVSIGFELRNTRAYANVGSLPFALFGETVLGFGFYTKEEVEKLVPKIVGLDHRRFEKTNEALKIYRDFFREKSPLLDEKTRTRRFQVTGNCTLRQPLEWMVEIFERHGMDADINRLIVFASSRKTGKDLPPPLAVNSGDIAENWIEVDKEERTSPDC